MGVKMVDSGGSRIARIVQNLVPYNFLLHHFYLADLGSGVKVTLPTAPQFLAQTGIVSVLYSNLHQNALSDFDPLSKFVQNFVLYNFVI